MLLLHPVAGIEHLSLIDWPGHISAVFFTRGCNFRCSWCHNKALSCPEMFAPLLPGEEVERFILKLDPTIYDGVVISGGEPLIHYPSLLPALLEPIRQRGLAVRLDTNGSFPQALASLLEGGLVSEVAVDYKLPFGMYGAVGCQDTGAVKESLAYVALTGRGYIRTALIDGVHTPEVVKQMEHDIYYLLGSKIDWRFNNATTTGNAA